MMSAAEIREMHANWRTAVRQAERRDLRAAQVRQWAAKAEALEEALYAVEDEGGSLAVFGVVDGRNNLLR